MTKKFERNIVLLSAVLIGFVLFAAVYGLWRNHRAEQLYQDICTQLGGYPHTVPSDGYSVCYIQKDDVAYIFFYSEGVTILGRRNQERELFYVEESVCTVSSGASAETDSSRQNLMDAIAEGISGYLTQPNVTYTYHKPSGSALPMWISPLDPWYLRVQRPDNPGNMEVMTMAERDNGSYLHWNILAPDESVLLYLSSSDISSSYGNTYVPGWGELPQHLFEMQLN